MSKKCAYCESEAIRKQGNQHFCARHYRFRQMRTNSRQRGKACPERDQLEAMVPPGMRCPDCGVQMNWLANDGQATVVTIQHYRDGTIGLVCRSCNTRHAYTPGDVYRDMPKDHKYCPRCETIKPFSEYHTDNGRGGNLKLKSWCKPCASKSHTEWQRRNRDHYNETQREGRARRKQSHGT